MRLPLAQEGEGEAVVVLEVAEEVAVVAALELRRLSLELSGRLVVA